MDKIQQYLRNLNSEPVFCESDEESCLAEYTDYLYNFHVNLMEEDFRCEYNMNENDNDLDYTYKTSFYYDYDSDETSQKLRQEYEK